MSDPTAPRPSRRVAIVVAAAAFMEFLDGTIIATAAPDMARSLHVRPAEISIAITAYLLTLGVLIPLSGWLAQRWGTRTVFVAAIAIFTVASGLCAMSTSLPMLAALRVMQGMGGAMMVPVGRLVVFLGAPKTELIRLIAFLTWPALAAPVAAPLLGGLLTTYLSWHWIFLINLPIGLVLAAGSLRWLPQLRDGARVPMDWLGFALSAGCLSGVVVASSELGADDADARVVLVSGACAVLAGAGALRHLMRTEHPLLDLSVFRVATFRIAHVSGSLYRATVFALPFVLPLMLQVGLGMSAVRAGALVMLVFIGNLVIKPLTTPILRRFTFRAVLVTAGTVVAVTMLLCGMLTASTPTLLVVVLLVVSGAARSVGFTAYGTLALSDVETPMMTAANTVSSTLQQLAGGFGVALGAIALRATALGAHAGSALSAYRSTFALLALLTLTVVVPAWRLPAHAGERLHGNRAPSAGAEPDAA